MQLAPSAPAAFDYDETLSQLDGRMQGLFGINLSWVLMPWLLILLESMLWSHVRFPAA
jgi:hypothetical protein